MIELGQGIGYLDLDTTAFTNGLKSAISDLKGFQNQTTSNLYGVSNTLNKVGSALTSRLTKPAIAASTALAGISLTKGWSRMTAIDTAKGKLRALSKAAVAAGKDAYDVGGIMNNALEAVKGTAYGLDEAVTAAASAVAAGIKPGKDLTQYLTTVGDAAAVSGRSMQSMGAIFGKVATAGRAQNMELNMIADSGITIFQSLSDILGISTTEVREWAAEGKISADLFYKAMDRAVGGAAKEIGSTTITGAIANLGAAMSRVGANLLGDSENSEMIAGKILKILNDLTKTLGIVEEKAKGWGKSLGAGFQKLLDLFYGMSNQSRILAGAIAVGIGPAIKLGAAVLGCTARFRSFLVMNEGMSASMGVLTGKLSLGQATVGRFTNALGNGIKSLATFISGQAKAAAVTAVITKNTYLNTDATIANAAAQSSLGQKLGMASKSLLAFATAHKTALIATTGFLAPLIALGVYMGTTGASAEEVSAKIGQFANTLSMYIQSFGLQLPTLMESFATAASSVFGTLAQQIPVILPTLTQGFVTLFQSILGTITAVAPQLINAFTTALQAIIGALPTVLPALISGAMALFEGLVTGLTQMIPQLMAAVPPLVVSLVTALMEQVPVLLTGAVQLFTAFVSAIPQIIPSVVGAIPQLIQSVVSTLPTLIPRLLSGAVSLFMAFVKAIPKVVISLVKNAPKLVTGIVKGVLSAGKSLVTTGASLLRKLWNGISGWTGSLWSNIKSFARKIPDKIVSGVGSLLSTGKDLISGLWKGIKEGFSGLFGKVGEKLGKLKDTIKSKLGIGSPSWIAAEYGNWFMEGMNNGFQKGFKKVFNTVTEQSKDILNTFDKMNSNIVFDIPQSPEMRIAKSLEALSTGQQTTNGGVDIVNNINIDGAENPLQFMNTFTRQLKIDMRAL